MSGVLRCLLCGAPMPTLASEGAHGKGLGQCSELRIGDLVHSGLSPVLDEIISGPSAIGEFILQTPDGNFYRSPMAHLHHPRHVLNPRPMRG